MILSQGFPVFSQHWLVAMVADKAQDLQVVLMGQDCDIVYRIDR